MKIIERDLLSNPVGTIAHQVNCRGVMGTGIALAIRKRWPEVFDRYKQYLTGLQNRGVDPLGMVQHIQVSPTLYVANCFGQRDYGRDKRYTSYGAVAMCLEKLASPAIQQPVYIPYRMGCMNAGGDWDKVLQLIEICAPDITICRIGG